MTQISSIKKIEHSLDHLIGGGALSRCTLQSYVLGEEKTFTIYLPAGYDESERRYPTLYLFHSAGATDETWTRTGLLKEIADDSVRSGMAAPMIIVMPDASGSDERHLGKNLGYFSVDGHDYEKYFHEELIPAVDNSFRTVADKAHRAIGGVSMGAEGAIAYAQKYPSYYTAACSLSGILGKPEQSVMAHTDKAYGDGLIANNPSLFVQKADDETVEALKSVKWYADCGDNDFFREGNIEFFQSMKEKGIAITYRMRTGVHGWYYWITGLSPILTFLTTAFSESE